MRSLKVWIIEELVDGRLDLFVSLAHQIPEVPRQAIVVSVYLNVTVRDHLSHALGPLKGRRDDSTDRERFILEEADRPLDPFETFLVHRWIE